MKSGHARSCRFLAYTGSAPVRQVDFDSVTLIGQTKFFLFVGESTEAFNNFPYMMWTGCLESPEKTQPLSGRESKASC